MKFGIRRVAGTLYIFIFLILFSTLISASQTYPNEPSGFVKFTERPFDAVVEEGWDYTDSTRFTIVQDPTAPKSPQNVGQMFYPAGFTENKTLDRESHRSTNNLCRTYPIR
ncbi:MAG: hypothetical protein UY14_C0010G0002 [Parcubacteria group bacterium GW2011_GWA1_47_9]|nr:MAG: hypothetical protein UY14_C0010G0002 [Parcubacteria group bacterium GW2011_GWA1_47_9]